MAISVDSLRKDYGGRVALAGVSFEVARGEVFALLGPNGAGKTTLLNCVSGFQRYEAGTVRLRGRAIDRVAPERRARLGVARTFQNLGLVGTATVEDNLLLAQHGLAGYSAASALAGLPASRRRERELRARALDVLSLFHVGHLAPAPVRSLPYGLRKVVELAGAVVREPELLLLDEPSSGLSVDEGRALLETMAEAVGHLELSVLVVEHHVPLVNEFCRWVYVLDAGRVIAAGEPGEVHRRQAVVDAFLGAEVPT